MSGFLYFIERLGAASIDVLRDMGLGYAFDSAPGMAACDGPGNISGLLVADLARLGEYTFGYLPAEQTWRRCPAKGGAIAHVGFYTAAKPTPAGLARAKQLPGKAVKLGDGHEWTVPLLRFHDGDDGFRTALPVDYDVDDEGNWIVGGTTDAYEELDRVAQRLVDGMLLAELGKAPRITTGEALDIASSLLGWNYTVSKAELGRQMLGLLRRDETLMEVLKAAIDFDTLDAWAVKKNGEAAGG